MEIDTRSPVSPPSSMISSRSDAMSTADFLKMLVAQLGAQDPMNPLDGQDFASQLATFSSLQELQQMNESLDIALQSNLLLSQSFNNTMSSFLVGKVVKAHSDQVRINDEGGAAISFQLNSAATNVTVEIRDSEGEIVRTINANARDIGAHEVEWDGLDADGRRVPPGSYSVSIQGEGSDGRTVLGTPFIEGRVTEIVYDSSGVYLHIGNTQIQIGDVISISEPPQTAGGGGGIWRW